MQGESCLNYISLFLRADEADFSAGFRPVGDKKRQGGGGRPPWRRGTDGQADWAGVSSLMRRNRSRAGTKKMHTRQAVKPPL